MLLDSQQTCRHRDAAVSESVPTSHASSRTCVQRVLCAVQHLTADSAEHKHQRQTDAASLSVVAPAIKPITVSYQQHSSSISTTSTAFKGKVRYSAASYSTADESHSSLEVLYNIGSGGHT